MTEIGPEHVGVEAVEVDLEVGRRSRSLLNCRMRSAPERHEPDLADAAEGGGAPEHEVLVASDVQVGVDQVDVQLVALTAYEVVDAVAVGGTRARVSPSSNQNRSAPEPTLEQRSAPALTLDPVVAGATIERCRRPASP